MTNSPSDAYEAAKQARAARQQTAAEAEARQNSFPARAKARLEEIASHLDQKTPKGLRLGSELNKAGSLKNGVVGLFLKLYEGDVEVAQGSINCDDTETVHFKGYSPDGAEPRKEVPLGKSPFSELTDQKATDFLANLISRFLV